MGILTVSREARESYFLDIIKELKVNHTYPVRENAGRFYKAKVTPPPGKRA